jgi:hypothetical protein
MPLLPQFAARTSKLPTYSRRDTMPTVGGCYVRSRRVVDLHLRSVVASRAEYLDARADVEPAELVGQYGSDGRR